jgi:hypothetical protein
VTDDWLDDDITPRLRLHTGCTVCAKNFAYRGLRGGRAVVYLQALRGLPLLPPWMFMRSAPDPEQVTVRFAIVLPAEAEGERPPPGPSFRVQSRYNADVLEGTELIRAQGADKSYDMTLPVPRQQPRAIAPHARTAAVSPLP